MRLARLFQRAAAFNLPRRAVFPAALPRPAALRRLATVGTPAPETAKPAEMQKAAETGPLKTTIYFTIPDRTGALERVLSFLSNTLVVNLKRIESRPSTTAADDYDIFCDFVASPTQVEKIIAALQSLQIDSFSGLGLVKEVRVVGMGDAAFHASSTAPIGIPWFPRRKSDMDSYADKILSYGVELDADHPGFTDEAYRARRTEIARRAKEHRHGQPLPRAEYTPEEVSCWTSVWDKLIPMHAKHACKEFNYVFPLLERECGYRRDNIPQLEDVSRFLKGVTGFTLRPVAGLLSPRDFLNALAFRVFHSTQYIRHPSKPLYTPEPDVVHELLGHVPLFADPDFADLSQEIGLASLGASEEEIKRLSTIYWFSAEFGLVSQAKADAPGVSEVKAYGAGLLSSFGELEWSIEKANQANGPTHIPFDPDRAGRTEYGITDYQQTYFLASSLTSLKDQILMHCASSFPSRPFAVRYNALTEQVEVLDSKERLVRFARQVVRGDLSRLVGAVERM